MLNAMSCVDEAALKVIFGSMGFNAWILVWCC